MFSQLILRCLWIYSCLIMHAWNIAPFVMLGNVTSSKDWRAILEPSNAAPEWQARALDRRLNIGGGLSTRGACWKAPGL